MGKGIISKGLWCNSNKIMISMTFIFFLFFMIFTPLNKMTASPSFITLSILFSFIMFALIEWIISNIHSLKKLEFIGRKPLRYWLLMYIVFLIPLWFYIEFSKQSSPLNIDWYLGIAISLMLMFFLLVISNLIDYKTISN